MVDGPTETTDLDRTEYNREIVRSFVEEILINGKFDKLDDYIDDERFIEHNPRIRDGVSALCSALSDPVSNEGTLFVPTRNTLVLVKGERKMSAYPT